MKVKSWKLNFFLHLKSIYYRKYEEIDSLHSLYICLSQLNLPQRSLSRKQRTGCPRSIEFLGGIEDDRNYYCTVSNDQFACMILVSLG